MSSFVRIGAAVIIGLAAVGVGVTAATPVTSTQIAYVGKIPELHKLALYTINSDGSDRQLITPRGGVAASASFSWSPDGQQIVFARVRQNQKQIVVINADGSGLKRLTAGALASANPSWSPDGELIAFDRDDASEHRQIWVMRADGSGKMKLTRSAQWNEWPTWSPDSGKILFERYFSGNRMELYTMDSNGGGKRKIARVRTTTWDAGDFTWWYCACAAWSPDGTKIAYEAVTERKKPDIFVMNADGTGRTRLTRLAWSRDENPDWSPDGTQIAFYSERVGNAEIYVMNADGTEQHRVTHDPWYDCCPGGSHRRRDRVEARVGPRLAIRSPSSYFSGSDRGERRAYTHSGDTTLVGRRGTPGWIVAVTGIALGGAFGLDQMRRSHEHSRQLQKLATLISERAPEGSTTVAQRRAEPLSRDARRNGERDLLRMYLAPAVHKTESGVGLRTLGSIRFALLPVPFKNPRVALFDGLAGSQVGDDRRKVGVVVGVVVRVVVLPVVVAQRSVVVRVVRSVVVLAHRIPSTAE